MALPASQPDIITNSESCYVQSKPDPSVNNHTACLTEYRIPGYLVSPENLIKVLRTNFNDNYKVKE
ncbi:hypothetical protein F4677DRAFT_436729 [Hypoxylon crocopeplum]|nr:hypothetical protein F4677DRAFT_436729 [Hypoxylon crocopeplum]